MSTYRVIIIFVSLFFSLISNAQISKEVIEKAHEAGISDSEIKHEIHRMNVENGTRELNGANGNVTDQSQVNSSVDPLHVINSQSTMEVDNRNIVFGREIFSNSNLTFTPDLNIPTPVDYILASGDELLINVWGDSQMSMNKTINPEGVIYIDHIGPVFLSGLTILEAEIKIRNELGRIMSTIVDTDKNTHVSVSLGKIRSIKVNIVGEAYRPGTYTLPSISTLFTALHSAGGVNRIGSLRNIRVFRNSKEVATLDIYDFLLNGNYESDIRLENNDMILIDPYEQFVSIEGHIKRNRTFELKKGETIQDLLKMSGGFLGDAYSEEIRVKRVTSEKYKLFTVSDNEYNSFLMHDGDEVLVSGAINFYENRVTIKGAVWRSGEYELTESMNTIKKLVEKAKGLKGDEFAGRARLTRLNPDFTNTVLAVDIKGIMNDTSPDIELKEEDVLHIPSIFDLREPYSVKVRGAVNNPGTFPYRNNMTVEDLIVFAGGLKESASLINVEIARRIKNPMSTNSSNQIAEIFNIVLDEELYIRPDEDVFLIEPFDEIYVKYSPEYTSQQVINIRGEITFVGEYVLSIKNERLSDIVKKAGGITPDAYARGASLKRKVSKDELRRLETLMEISSNQQGNDSIPLSNIDLSEYSVGIDLEKALKNPGSADDIVLQNGDQLYIPQYQSTVKISGSVNYPNSVTYTKGMQVKDCLSQAGGYLDISRKYPIVIYMNGKVATTKKRFIFFKKYPKIEAGSEVIVPSRTYSDRKLSPMEILSISTSTTSMAAMITSLINTLNKN